jgi:hypothetical protein
MTVPTISVYNQATTALGFDLGAFVKAMEEYIGGYLAPAWGCNATLAETTGPLAGTWGMVFLDTADVQGALAYHTDDGLPLAKVFVKTTLDAGESVTVSATHELAEMLVDPGCCLWSMNPAGLVFAYECADAVEETTFQVQGFQMSDFCLPAWFGAPGNQFDYCNTLTAPFTLAHGGYQTTFSAGQMSQTFGSADKASRFALEDRRGHRSEYRRGLFVP